jgi:hypothetical protein
MKRSLRRSIGGEELRVLNFPAVGRIFRLDVLADPEKFALPLGIDVGDSSAGHANLDLRVPVGNRGCNDHPIGLEK